MSMSPAPASVSASAPRLAHPLVQTHARNSAALLLVGLICGIGLFYLVLIRPFSAGFDLVSVGQGEGIRANTLISPDGQEVQNQLRALTSLILDGEYAGSLITLNKVEQLADEERPFIYGLEIFGRDEAALIIGQGYPGEEDGLYVFDQGVFVQAGDNALKADTLIIDENQGQLETIGPTDLSSRDMSISAENGIEASQEGDFEIR